MAGHRGDRRRRRRLLREVLAPTWATARRRPWRACLSGLRGAAWVGFRPVQASRRRPGRSAERRSFPRCRPPAVPGPIPAPDQLATTFSRIGPLMHEIKTDVLAFPWTCISRWRLLRNDLERRCKNPIANGSGPHASDVRPGDNGGERHSPKWQRWRPSQWSRR